MSFGQQQDTCLDLGADQKTHGLYARDWPANGDVFPAGDSRKYICVRRVLDPLRSVCFTKKQRATGYY